MLLNNEVQWKNTIIDSINIYFSSQLCKKINKGCKKNY